MFCALQTVSKPGTVQSTRLIFGQLPVFAKSGLVFASLELNSFDSWIQDGSSFLQWPHQGAKNLTNTKPESEGVARALNWDSVGENVEN